MPYFDHNATAPVSPAARAAWLKASEEAWHNPSSPYRSAARTRSLLEQARTQLARMLESAPDRIVFTSGATESANAIFSFLAAYLPAGARLALSPLEHPCVLQAARHAFAERRVFLPVGADGRVDPAEVVRSIESDGVALVAVMAANNETGIIQPWQEIARLCRARKAIYLCDAVQWLGKLPAAGFGNVDVALGSAHKFGGPKGVGFLKLGPGMEGFRSLLGGEQERGHRGGTENYPGVAGMLAALVEAEEGRVLSESSRLDWRRRFETEIVRRIPGSRLVGPHADRLWNTVSLILPQYANHRWVARLDRAGFQISTGSACATGSEAPSHVLAALGIDAESARRAVRISAGWETQQEEWGALADALEVAWQELQTDSGEPGLTEVVRI